MNIEGYFLEGTKPAIVPNAGHRLSVNWMDSDRRRFSDLLRSKFPNVLFFEAFHNTDGKYENFRPCFVEHLDESRPGKSVDAVFPPPAWRPEVVLIPDPRLPHWTWKNYLSPQISIMPRFEPGKTSVRNDWKGHAANERISVWRGTTIMTSYRRELEAERRIQAAALRLATKVCRQLVPVRWESYGHYRNRDGEINPWLITSERNFASQGVIDWARAEPRREIDLSVNTYDHIGNSWYAPEDIPDAWWGDIPKPKWAQRP